MGRPGILKIAADQLVGIVPMGQDPQRLKPGALLQLLNSTPLGEVLTDRKLRRHREAGGVRIGQGKTINLLRYSAWLCQQEIQKSLQKSSLLEGNDPAPSAAYQTKKLREAERNRQKSRIGRDIFPLPDVVDPDRRRQAEASFQKFCETYFGELFALAWSADHLRVIAKIEGAVIRGGTVCDGNAARERQDDPLRSGVPVGGAVWLPAFHRVDRIKLGGGG